MNPINNNCYTCGEKAEDAPIILIDGQLHRIHTGPCYAKYLQEHPDAKDIPNDQLRELARQHPPSPKWYTDAEGET